MVDIDELIEAREHLTVSDIFARHGEPYFRAVERDVLGEQLPTRHAVVATGGGTFVDPQNRAVINRDGVSVWLDVPLERLIARIRPTAAGRWRPTAPSSSACTRRGAPPTSRRTYASTRDVSASTRSSSSWSTGWRHSRIAGDTLTRCATSF